VRIYSKYILRSLIYLHYAIKNNNDEVNEVINYLTQNPHIAIPMNTDPPYKYKEAYKNYPLYINFDDGNPFVIIDNNKIYFPANMSSGEIMQSVITALIEQHDNSPHKYLTDEFNIDEGDNVVLIGASDGIFAMSILSKANKIYLFEPDNLWVEALKHTFRPWGNKVVVINKYVLDYTSGTSVTLDRFIEDENLIINYIQVDVEGVEINVLKGAFKLLNRNLKLRLSICCYHNHNDAYNINKLLSDFKFSVTYSKGYYVMGLRKPYLRRGVIYAINNIVNTNVK